MKAAQHLMRCRGFIGSELDIGRAFQRIVPGDTNGRFPAMYVGTVAPLKQGRFDGCQITNGPGKVVLHQ